MSTIDPEIRKDIVKKLSHIESEYDVEILFAIESGSRAWGFESIDSDYDVRFVYRHKPSWYFNILPKRDVIELPIVGVDDYSGWDIRKALFLLNKSNPVFFEWLRSPIVYREETMQLTCCAKQQTSIFPLSHPFIIIFTWRQVITVSICRVSR